MTTFDNEMPILTKLAIIIIHNQKISTFSAFAGSQENCKRWPKTLWIHNSILEPSVLF